MQVRNGRMTEEELERKKKEMEEEGVERVKKLSKKDWEARGLCRLRLSLSEAFDVLGIFPRSNQNRENFRALLQSS